MVEQQQSSRIPAATAADLPSDRSAIMVLDLTSFGPAEPERAAYLSRVGEFLNYARSRQVPICFTGISLHNGKPVESVLGRLDEEPLWYPAAYDKFYGGEIQAFLSAHGSENIVILGASTNNCVMYTATTAARHFDYETYVPIDGSYAEDPYCHEFALYQLSVIPRPPKPVHFTTLSGTTFH